MKKNWPKIILPFLALLAILGIYKTEYKRKTTNSRLRIIHRPQRIMGTTTEIVAIPISRHQKAQTTSALKAAEKALRDVEAKMSSWINSSEISQLNAAKARERITLSNASLAVLRRAKSFYIESDKCFDIACKPLIKLWKNAAKENRYPRADEIDAAKIRSRMTDVIIGENKAFKLKDSTRVDLGGIAKGYGIDQATEALIRSNVLGGMVDVGGDLRVFGLPPHGEYWLVDIQDPFAKQVKIIATLALKKGAVCTSGNYARYITIEGKRYSHIIDPRSGIPAKIAPSVTVIATTSMEADIWATALSILGAKGLEKLPKDVHALVIQGDSIKSAQCFASKELKQFIKNIKASYLNTCVIQ